MKSLAHIAVPTLVLAAVLAGCTAPTVSLDEAKRQRELAQATLQYERADPRLGQLPSVYLCGGREVAVGHVGQQLRVTVGPEQALLMPVVAASGAQYQNPGDSGTSVWFKGDAPLVHWKGDRLGTCRVLKHLVSPFKAQGYEPGWQLLADGSAITLRWGSGTKGTDALEGVKVSAQQPLSVGRTVALGHGAGATEVTVFHRLCKDAVSGLPHPFTATVHKDGRTLTGCGGDSLSVLQHRQWQVLSSSPVKGGAAAPTDATLRFEPDGRLTGQTGCNLYNGRYRLDGAFLRLEALVTTRRACLGPAMAAEQAFLRWLPRVSRYDVAEDGALTLLTTDGDAFTARAL